MAGRYPNFLTNILAAGFAVSTATKAAGLFASAAAAAARRENPLLLKAWGVNYNG